MIITHLARHRWALYIIPFLLISPYIIWSILSTLKMDVRVVNVIMMIEFGFAQIASGLIFKYGFQGMKMREFVKDHIDHDGFYLLMAIRGMKIAYYVNWMVFIYVIFQFLYQEDFAALQL